MRTYVRSAPAGTTDMGRVVSMMRVVFHPTAKCDSCRWTEQGPNLVGLARQHIRANPMHVVTVEAITRSAYGWES